MRKSAIFILHLDVGGRAFFHTFPDARALVIRRGEKFFQVDPIPSRFIMSCLEPLLLVLTDIMNLSLKSGVFIVDWKEAIITPLLKKGKTECDLKNYQLSKLAEWCLWAAFPIPSLPFGVHEESQHWNCIVEDSEWYLTWSLNVPLSLCCRI